MNLTTSTTGEPESFIDAILLECEEAELQQKQAYMDLLGVELKRLSSEMEKNTSVAEKEKSLIDDWCLKRNTRVQERIDFLAKKLRVFLEEIDVKTLDMPNVTLRIRKRPDRVEIEDMDVFLENADPSMLDSVPESCKANLSKIKSFIKRTTKVPEGCRLITGDEAFSYKLKFEEESDGTDETGVGVEQSEDC